MQGPWDRNAMSASLWLETPSQGRIENEELNVHWTSGQEQLRQLLLLFLVIMILYCTLILQFVKANCFITDFTIHHSLLFMCLFFFLSV